MHQGQLTWSTDTTFPTSLNQYDSGLSTFTCKTYERSEVAIEASIPGLAYLVSTSSLQTFVNLHAMHCTADHGYRIQGSIPAKRAGLAKYGHGRGLLDNAIGIMTHFSNLRQLTSGMQGYCIGIITRGATRSLRL